MKPDEIEKESFRIILEELGPHTFSTEELPIVQRVIHATADFEYANLLKFTPTAIADGIQALRSGAPLVSDVKMIAAGVNHNRLERYGCAVHCLVSDEKVQEAARLAGRTRAETAMRALGDQLNGAIVAIGNAPTALFEVLRLAADEGIRPALIVGVPVGFVNAVESKQALSETTLPAIYTTGRKGGSTVAVAIINALLRLVEA